jgi:hypothetical protein
MSKAVLVQADDWEGLFIDGKLVREGHTLNQGSSRIKYFIKLAEKYDFDIKELEEGYVTEDFDENYLEECGHFPKSLSEVEYEVEEDEN